MFQKSCQIHCPFPILAFHGLAGLKSMLYINRHKLANKHINTLLSSCLPDYVQSFQARRTKLRIMHVKSTHAHMHGIHITNLPQYKQYLYWAWEFMPWIIFRPSIIRESFTSPCLGCRLEKPSCTSLLCLRHVFLFTLSFSHKFLMWSSSVHARHEGRPLNSRSRSLSRHEIECFSLQYSTIQARPARFRIRLSNCWLHTLWSPLIFNETCEPCTFKLPRCDLLVSRIHLLEPLSVMPVLEDPSCKWFCSYPAKNPDSNYMKLHNHVRPAKNENVKLPDTLQSCSHH